MFSDRAKTVALWTDHTNFLVGSKTTASGWGSTGITSRPNDLYAVEMPVVSKANSAYATATVFDDLMIIAGENGGE